MTQRAARVQLTRSGGTGRKPRTAHAEEAKTKALAIYAETGSTLTAAEATGIPRRTIANWIERDPEIDAKLDAFRRVVRERAAHLFAEGAVLGAEATIDRLKNGDWIHKGGQLVRVPVPAREASFIASVFVDKHTAITGGMAKQSDQERSLTDLAKQLVEEMERRKKSRPAEIVDQPIESQD